ncbi:hypothetical protein PCANC_05575 [Puccinia coronata f. sp. avenae]|uniref:Uncharacterized protein n=1 Tax=Puccinia coronata f. sp. avenae TaxID=200324 RepID=A0A2N5VP72_9BASI|nr:hypothetical protein PCANC_15151 [Puccinia coronata f. sp. avenae]PLW50109.1 hypothetical protein PCASD_01876 [Puccinia coronata f. sp. avenae]PLW51782.1 hypothetical protein PCANC_05575 [Puccinia coronata f. sp. avenae]
MSSKRVVGQTPSDVPNALLATDQSNVAALSAELAVPSDTVMTTSLNSGDAAARAPTKTARVTKSKEKDAGKKGGSQEIRQTAKCDGLHDVQSSDSKDAIFEIAKELPANPTSNSKGSLTSDKHLVLWKMARDADIRGDAMTSLTLMSFLNEGKVSHVIPVGTRLPEVPNPRLNLSVARSELPGVVLKPSTCTAPLAIPVKMTPSGDIGKTVYEKGLAFTLGAISNSTIVGFSPLW